MGKKIFVSYKYGDTSVKALKEPLEEFYNPTKVRDYVSELQLLIDKEDHINKGESDNESLANFKDSTIESKLRRKIHNSSVTIVIISPNMKDSHLTEHDQWIPWEIAYSLRESTREGRTSLTNAVLAVVLPDRNNSYNYFIKDNTCPKCNCRTLETAFLFQILRENMFNIKKPTYSNCDNHQGNPVYLGEYSYINSVKWSDFKNNVNFYINEAVKVNENIDDYNIVKTVK
ncbi:MAG TPA: TIR domain-containing protein [bacterium]|nr:TIR domain-containing protein [bacterium]HOG42795.1 TIR domain-containing protein [bacterium]HPY13691.1 TIR domain-containing protein [bacterium]HQB08930.1 TIR domain-containing protein [bacterium]HQM84096.1 TIR domain-containing protein [bacterium]